MLMQIVFAQQDEVYEMQIIRNNGKIECIVVQNIDNIIFEKIECIDADLNEYRVVKIGDQWWMAENLKVTKYRNGDPIANITDNSTWTSLSTGAYCYYNNDSNNGDIYGCLYNWYAVNDSRKIAPEGWHVPTDAEWTELKNYLTNNGHSGTEGTALKSTTGWYNNGNGTDDYGFTGLPAGYRNYTGDFDAISYNTYFWSTSENNADYARYWNLNYLLTSLNWASFGNKRGGHSVRCVRD